MLLNDEFNSHFFGSPTLVLPADISLLKYPGVVLIHLQILAHLGEEGKEFPEARETKC